MEQLIKKDCSSGEYNNIYPVTTIQSIIDRDTGETLEGVLSKVNHIYLPFKDNCKSLTRQQVPPSLRRKGLWISYVSCKRNVVTEYYNSDDFEDKAWGDNKNWVPYIDKDLIQEIRDTIADHDADIEFLKKVAGISGDKGLSTNDFTDELKEKLVNIEYYATCDSPISDEELGIILK